MTNDELGSLRKQADGDRALSTEDRRALAAMVMRLRKHWRLSDDEMTGLLGLSHLGGEALDRFRSGEALATASDLKARVSHLLAIHRLLRTVFPQNRDLAYQWPMTPNKAFGQKAPVAFALEQGTAGLALIRAYLERAGACDLQECRTMGEVLASLPFSDRPLRPLRVEPLGDDGLPEAHFRE